MVDMLIVLTVLAAVSVYYYGARAAIVASVSASVCCITDFICLKLRKKDIPEKDISALITGLTLGLMMSASASYFSVAAASVFAVVIAKHAFGGRGCEIFNAAAAGFLFTSLCFPGNMLTYPKPFSDIPLSSLVSESILGQSMTKTFLMTETSYVSEIDMLIGKFSGPMGTGFTILLAVAAVFLMARRSIPAIVFLSELASAGIAALIHYGLDPVSLLCFLSGGMFLFGIIFLSCDYITAPKTKSSQLIYGITVGLCTALFHFYAHAENAIVYAVIISAPVGIELNRRSLSLAAMLNKKSGVFSKISKPFRHVAETIDILNKNNDKK